MNVYIIMLYILYFSHIIIIAITLLHAVSVSCSSMVWELPSTEPSTSRCS